MADRVLAEFASDDAIAAAIRQLRDRGYTRLEVYMPYWSHEVEHALARRPSRLPWMIGAVGACAAAGAFALQWLLVGYLYPLVVGQRPPAFPLVFVIITFEMGVLFAGFAAFFGTLAVGRLVRLVDEVQDTPGFDSVTRDRFWLEIRLDDPQYDERATESLLRDLGATRVTAPREEDV